MRARLLALVVALACLMSFVVASAHADTAEYTTFTPSTRYQTCYDENLVGGGSACDFPSDATFDRDLSADPDGSFTNSISATGGNLVTATKATGRATETLTVTTDHALSAVDMTFTYRIDELGVTGSSDCGLIMSAQTGCLQAGGSTQLNFAPPAGGHLCTDDTDSPAGYGFGFTAFGLNVKRAKKPGRYTGGYYLACHGGALVSAGTTLTLVFNTNTAISASGGETSATVAGQLLGVSLVQ